jgi:hypothetical protein
MQKLTFPKNRRFANSPAEYAKLLHECINSYLRSILHNLNEPTQQGQKERNLYAKIMRITQYRITKDNFQHYINMDAESIIKSFFHY